MILAIDIGNSNTHMAVFKSPSYRIIAHETIPNAQLNGKFLNKVIRINGGCKCISEVKEIIYCSTKPEITPIVVEWAKKIFKLMPLEAGQDFPIPLINKTTEPEKVGKDRLLGALGAYELLGHDSFTIVIDSGTAVTFNIISPKGEFLGGVIAPGLSTLAKSLSQNCSQLPLLDTPDKKTKLPGRNTTQAINAGVYYGFTGLVKNILMELIYIYKKPAIVVTGGDAKLIKSAIPFKCKIIPWLTVKGLLAAFLAHS